MICKLLMKGKTQMMTIINYEDAKNMIKSAKMNGTCKIKGETLAACMNYISNDSKFGDVEIYELGGDSGAKFIVWKDHTNKYKLWMEIGNIETLFSFVRAFISLGINVVPDAERENCIVTWNSEKQQTEFSGKFITAWSDIFTPEQLEMIYQDPVDDVFVPENFIDAVKTVADLYKVLGKFQSIGINLEGYVPDSDDNIGSNIWAAITNATNIALRELGYDVGDENANRIFQDFISEYNLDGNNELEIQSYYTRYKINNLQEER